MKINKKTIEELAKYLEEFNLTEIQYSDGNTSAKVSREVKVNTTTSVEVSKKKVTKDESGINIKSPIVGTVYLAPEPGGKKFIEVGDKIKKGQTVVIVEAMKTMNHVPATENGIVKKIFIKDGEPVEFGQILVSLN